MHRVSSELLWVLAEHHILVMCCMDVRLSVYVRMYICLYLCMYVCKYACMHACTYVHIGEYNEHKKLAVTQNSKLGSATDLQAAGKLVALDGKPYLNPKSM